jgi:hypothetical protein
MPGIWDRSSICPIGTAGRKIWIVYYQILRRYGIKAWIFSSDTYFSLLLHQPFGHETGRSHSTLSRHVRREREERPIGVKGGRAKWRTCE